MHASHYRAVAPLPELGIMAGDLVRYQPGQDLPLELIRCLDIGRLADFLAAVANGQLQRLDPAEAVLRLADGGNAEMGRAHGQTEILRLVRDTA